MKNLTWMDNRYLMVTAPRQEDNKEWSLLIIDCSVDESRLATSTEALFGFAVLVLDLPAFTVPVDAGVDIQSYLGSQPTQQYARSPNYHRQAFYTSEERAVHALTVSFDDSEIDFHFVFSAWTIISRLRLTHDSPTPTVHVPWDAWGAETRCITTNVLTDLCSLAHTRFAVFSHSPDPTNPTTHVVAVYDFLPPAALRREAAMDGRGAPPLRPRTARTVFKPSAPHAVHVGFAPSTVQTALPYRYDLAVFKMNLDFDNPETMFNFYMGEDTITFMEERESHTM